MIVVQRKIPASIVSSTMEDSSTSSTVSKEKKATKQTKKQVRFCIMEIHEHPIEMGGSSIPRCGAPFTIGWARQAHYLLQVDDYETYKPPSRTGDQMLFSQSQRRGM